MPKRNSISKLDMGSIQKHFNRELSDLLSEESKVDNHMVVVDKMVKVDGPTENCLKVDRKSLVKMDGLFGEVIYGI